MGLFGKKKAGGDIAPSVKETVTLEDGRSFEVVEVVDCLGDSCPRPQLLTKKALANAAPGDVIEVRIDNPTSLETVVSMIPDLGGGHLGTIKMNRGWHVVVKKL